MEKNEVDNVGVYVSDSNGNPTELRVSKQGQVIEKIFINYDSNQNVTSVRAVKVEPREEEYYG